MSIIKIGNIGKGTDFERKFEFTPKCAVVGQVHFFLLAALSVRCTELQQSFFNHKVTTIRQIPRKLLIP